MGLKPPPSVCVSTYFLDRCARLLNDTYRTDSVSIYNDVCACNEVSGGKREIQATEQASHIIVHEKKAERPEFRGLFAVSGG